MRAKLLREKQFIKMAFPKIRYNHKFFTKSGQQNKFFTKSGPQNKFFTKSGPSKFILMTLFLGMRPLVVLSR
ncbi:MAG: hypothetical protein DRR00_29380 [Candidatus Parabeggiatoa sp. nov. 3]|nr:MAG: hypothetical protein DRR00_29380 [Gammaproteobacteria bacterium]RKZ55160.1 MAG: hypothetical protein DRQ99_30350 [Gammaproteobacteria bacterium]